MSIESSTIRNGAMIAIGAAALILAGCAGTGAKSASSGSEMVSCLGVNSCKGTGACKTAENACKGQNACKGHGFLTISSEDCSAKHGTII